MEVTKENVIRDTVDTVAVFSEVWGLITDRSIYLKGERILSVTNEKEMIKSNQADLKKNQEFLEQEF